VGSEPPLVAELPVERADALGLARGELVVATWSPDAARPVPPGDPAHERDGAAARAAVSTER